MHKLDWEVVACCRIEQFPKKAHDLGISGGLTRPCVNHGLVVTVEPDPTRVQKHGYSVPGWEEASPPRKVCPGLCVDPNMVMESIDGSQLNAAGIDAQPEQLWLQMTACQ